jgi:uncharacterized repeat protein (TIGR03803 family)
MKTWSKLLDRGIAGVVVAAFVWAAIAVQAQTYTPLYNFGSTAGDPINPVPFSAISQGRDGRLYSTTSVGGSHNAGAAYAITTGGTMTVLYNFPVYSSPTAPLSGLTLGTDGFYYGTTSTGGAHIVGTVFKLSDTGAYTNLWDFTGTGTDEGLPEAPLVLGADGNLYATTEGVYVGTYGTAFKISTKGVLKTLHPFKATDGATPYAILLGLDGNFYGVTRGGGAHNLGVIFKMTKAGKVTVLHSFAGTASSDGSLPIGGMVQANDGTLYGTTYGGGTKNWGTVFKILPTGNGYAILHNFDRTADINDGIQPLAGLALGTDGNVYGTSGGGGHQNSGALFRVTPAGAYATLYSFCAVSGCKDGFFPQTGMVQHTNGKFYGVTESGGQSVNGGEYYSLDMGLSPFVSLVSVWGKVGATIEVLGQGFTGSTSVKLGGTAANFTIVSDTYLTAKVPAGSSGFVTVTAPGGTLTSSRKFFVTPVVTSFAPPSGPVGTQVVITGNGLIQATKVAFGSKSAAFVVNSDTKITATVPTGAVTNKISITTPGGKATSKTSFTVTP